MSGWLPLQHEIRCILEDADKPPDEDDPFDQGDADGDDRDTMLEVVSHIRDSLSIAANHTPTRESTSIRTPVFLGHGAMDEKVLPSLGQEAFETLKALGFTTEWRGYQDEGHWYKIPDEIDDILDFIRVKVGWLAKQDT
ncbi:unnamed protein product [Parascedosporium putredinis]|uniref:Peptidase S9 prolyl oligopeptidase catalytic domain-containing protein n=1 Tax=Parascedosporium putredinis TaxID=1442378 RepID=A0A9P1GZ71_9PEZI|nr:unnamed protein product [Parascedosporium putredinis]CAI7992538.1 unnamed protein product [Parascedosporium putredinis]